MSVRRHVPASGSVDQVLVRPARALDIETCSQLAIEASGEPAARLDAWREGLSADLEDSERHLVVAVASDEIVGYGRARRFEPDPDSPVDVAPSGYYLLGLYVRADRRRVGIGSALIEARLLWIAERADEAWFFSNARNSASIALHARFGFEEVARRFWFPGVTFEGGEGTLFRTSIGDSAG